MRLGAESTRFEPVCAAAALAILAMLAVPREFATRALDGGGARTVDTVRVSLGLQTGEGLFASAVALALVALCAQALLRKRPLGPAALAVAAVAAALAVPGLADLMADMPKHAESESLRCANDPASYYEPDLQEHFRDLGGDGACVSSARSGRLVLSWLVALVLAASAGGSAFWRTGWRRGARVAGAVAAPVLAGGALLFLSLLMGLQHLE